MKTLKKLMMISFAMIFAFGAFAGCKDPVSSDSSGVSNSDSSTDEELVIERTNSYLVRNGWSDYKIVIPSNPSGDLEFAAKELNYFFNLATKVTLPIVTDANITDLDGKYLSIGETKILEAAGVKCLTSEIGYDGFILKTYGEALVMSGATDVASIYSVYGYLERQFNLEIYTEHVYTYDTPSADKLISIDLVDIPDIPVRSGGTYLRDPSAGASKEAASRYRTRDVAATWTSFGHTMLSTVTVAEYGETHPEYFNKNKTQLAYENEEMWDVYVEEMKERLANLQTDYVRCMFGIADNFDTPGGDNYFYDTDGDGVEEQHSVTYYEYLRDGTYGGFDSAMQIRFCNYVVRKLNEWTAEVYPNTKFEYYMYAYLQVQEPPVEWDSDLGKYVPVHEDVICESNLGVQIAPILAENISHPYNDKATNPNSTRWFNGWGEITECMTVWAYSTSFRDYLQFCNNFGAIKGNYQMYKDMGVTYLYEQGAYSHVVPNFMELRQYLYSKLGWDCSLDTEELIVNFHKAYYGEAWELQLEYFNLMRNHFSSLEAKGVFPYSGSTSSRGFTDKLYSDLEGNLPFAFLLQADKLATKALEKAQESGDEDVILAVRKDRMPVRFVLLEKYRKYYTASEYVSMIQEFESVSNTIGFVNAAESTFSIPALIESFYANV